MPCRQRQPGEGQRQAIGARHAVAPPERQAKDRHQREHGDALIPAERAGHLAQHLADEERAKRGRQRDQEGGGQGKVVARQACGSALVKNRLLAATKGKRGGKDQDRAQSDRNIGDVERGPVPVAPVKIKEISHGTLPQPVDDVAKRPAHDQRKTCPFQRVLRPKGHDGEDEGQRPGQRRHQKGLACHEPAHHAKARARH